MSSPASGSLRGLRVVVVAVAGTVLAAAAHVAAGGALPSATATATGAVIPAMAGLWITGRRRGWLSIAAALGAVQVLLHTWLMAGTATGPCLVAGGGGHAHAAGAAVSCAPAGYGSFAGAAGVHAHGAGSQLGHDSLTMVLAHLIAVVLMALLLAAGERALWQLVLWLRPAVQAACASLPVLPPGRSAPVVVLVPTRRPMSAELGGTGRRGPPRLG